MTTSFESAQNCQGEVLCNRGSFGTVLLKVSGAGMIWGVSDGADGEERYLVYITHMGNAAGFHVYAQGGEFAVDGVATVIGDEPFTRNHPTKPDGWVKGGNFPGNPQKTGIGGKVYRGHPGMEIGQDPGVHIVVGDLGGYHGVE